MRPNQTDEVFRLANRQSVPACAFFQTKGFYVLNLVGDQGQRLRLDFRLHKGQGIRARERNMLELNALAVS